MPLFNAMIAEAFPIPSLECLSDTSRGKEEVLQEATDFIGLCYGLQSEKICQRKGKS